jgi:hypothetical protein
MNRLPSIHVTSSIRTGTAALAAGAALLLAGCGTGGHSHRLATHRLASATSFTAVHSDQQVMQHFQAVSGQSLTLSRDPMTWDSLSLPAADNQGNDEFGEFTIDVLHNPDVLSTFTEDGGQRLVPDANGIYWPTAPDSNGFWNPAKIYGNVVLTWSTQDRSVGDQFRMLDAILSTLGQGTAAVDAKLPADLLSCQARGITPGGTAEGTCTENGIGRTVVNRGHTLHLSGYDVQITGTKLGNEIKSPFPYTPPTIANGDFVAVRLHVTNTGDTPLEELDEAELEIDGRYYSQDDDVDFDIANPDTFPMQPEESGNTAMAFDVPTQAAASALTQGELVFPEDQDSTIDFSSKLGAIRLANPSDIVDGNAGAGATSGATQPTPAPTPSASGSPATSA